METQSEPVTPGPSAQSPEMVKLPAIFLIVIASLAILYSLYGLVTELTGGNDEKIAQVISNPNLPAQTKEFVVKLTGMAWIFSIVFLVISAVILFGAVQMMRLRSWGLALTASILAMTPLFSGICCCLGLPLGIWSLVVLLKPEVKASFA